MVSNSQSGCVFDVKVTPSPMCVNWIISLLCYTGLVEHQLVTWSKDQTLRLWTVNPKIVKVWILLRRNNTPRFIHVKEKMLEHIFRYFPLCNLNGLTSYRAL